MSIKARIEDAEYLWHKGRIEGAWAMALIATDATAKKRYPTEGRNNVRFKQFIVDETGLIISGESASPKSVNIVFCSEKHSPGQPLDPDSHSFAVICYEFLRCHLLHEGKMPVKVTFSPITIKDNQMTETLKVGNSKTPHQIPPSWVLNLIKAIREAPENFDEFI